MLKESFVKCADCGDVSDIEHRHVMITVYNPLKVDRVVFSKSKEN